MMTIGAEWIKLWTLRSTWWALTLGVFISLALTVMGSWTVISRWHPGQGPDQAAAGIVAAVYVGVVLAQLPLGMLGAMTIAGEHASGMIDTTHVATPSRPRVLLAKATVLAVIALAASVLIAVPGYLYGRAIAAGYHPSMLPAEAWPMIGGGTLMIIVTTLLGLALGAMLRNGAVATAVLVAITLVVPFLARALPGGEVINKILPAYPALQLIHQVPAIMPTWAAFAVLIGWAVAPVAIASLLSPLTKTGD